MDFDNAKENIQPLASGRNVSLLQASLCQDASQELSAQRKQLELDIKNYTGSDPLEPWYAYICWIEQSYPAGGSNSGLQKVMHKCLTRFEQDDRYKQDPRLIKLFIKFMGNQGDQIECYQQMYNSGIGTMLADFYIAWAYSYDLGGNMRKANEIFRLGVECRAEPLDELKEAQQHFGYTVAQRMLYNDMEEATVVTQELNDRRLALRSLHGQKRKNNVTVGSVRTGAAIKSNMPGVVQSDAPSTSRAGRNANRQLEVFNDENADANMPPPPPPSASDAGPSTEGKSSLRSIIDAARQQENLKEPIAWSKPHKHGKIFAATAAHDPAFPIHVDEKTLPPITGYERNFDKPFKCPIGFVAKNKPQEPWVTPVTIEDEPNSTALPCYNKCMLYPRPNMEFSPEEYRAYCFFKRRNEQHGYVVRQEPWWGNGSGLGVRRYPNFASVSKPQPRDELDKYCKLPAVPALKTLLEKIYNDDEQQEYQLEELLAVKWQQKRNNTVHGVMDMEETVCLPGDQMPRRKSFIPSMLPGTSRKSIMPRISCVMEEDEEEEGQEEEEIKEQAPAPAKDLSPEKEQGKPVIKIWQDPEPEIEAPAASTSEQNKFVVPAAPLFNKIEIYEDDVMPPPVASKPAPSAFFDVDETCSTQMFNIFLKSQAVSTPKAPQKQAAVRQFGTLLKDTASPEQSEPEATPPPLTVPATQPASPLLRKQLSTILETSEHGAHGSTGGGTNATTKSTLISGSPGASKTETLQGAECTPGPSRLQRQMVSDLSVVGEETNSGAGNFERLELWEPNAPSVPLLKSLRFQEDKTETVTRPLLAACFQEDKTETLPRLPMVLPDTSVLLPPKLPQLPSEVLDKDEEEDDLCGLFAKSPPISKSFGSPLFAASSKRKCNQHTPEVFSKAKPTTCISKLAESFMADLSFVPETQPQSQPPKTQTPAPKTFAIFLDETMPPPEVPPMLNCTVPETQTIGPAHLTASFMKDCTELSSCPLPCPTPVKNQAAAAVPPPKFDIFLDESLPQPAEKPETIGPAHLTTSFMKDFTDLNKCPSPLPAAGSLQFLRNSQDNMEKSTNNTTKAECEAGKDYFELNAVTEMFAKNLSMIKNSTLLPEASKRMESVAKNTEPSLTGKELKLEDEKSIYYKKTPLTPKPSHNSWQESSFGSPPKQQFEHRKANLDESVLNSTLAQTNVNPFNVDIINSLLDSIEFSQYIEKLPNCQLQGHVKRLSPQSTVEVHGEKFEVEKMVDKGAYGSIFSGIHRKSGRKVAFKQEKPTNYWEFYICLEVHSRLAYDKMIPAFMNIDYALVGNNSSVYISEFSQYGSLISICNKFKKLTNKNLDEYVVMHLCCQLLDIVDHLHALGIIHADIKADNFLLMRPLSSEAKELSLQLIDFGVAIDTKLFPPNQTFDYVHNDETFKCIEMRTQRPWTYQLDLFGLVGVMHVLLFGRYMEVTQRQSGGIWMPKTAFPRYFNRQTWESIFRTLLNVHDCRTMPNLQELRTLLKLDLAEKEKYAEAAIAKFNMVLQRQK